MAVERTPSSSELAGRTLHGAVAVSLPGDESLATFMNDSYTK